MQELLKTQLIKETKQKRIDEINQRMISDFKTAFFLLHQRDAMQSEIIDNLKEKMDIATLRKMLAEQEFV
jgi:hypothetical protein